MNCEAPRVVHPLAGSGRALLLASLLVGLAQPAAALYANRDFFWSGNPVTIPVCWENPAAAPSARRDWVRSTIDSNWGRFARVNFTQWDTCTPGEPGIHILIDNASFAPGGSTLNGVDNGVHLDLSFASLAACNQSAAMLEHCVRAVALHEFGHVLGFYHEEERPDYAPGPSPPPGCAKQSYANSSPQYYGSFDLQSVMSYCGQPVADPSTWKTALSPGDIAALRRAYGRRIPGSIVSPGGNCVAAHATGPEFEPAFLWDCDEFADDQEWKLSQIAGRFAFSINRPPPLGLERCLESGSDPASPTTFIRSCAPGAAGQRWRLESLSLRGWGGMCLDLAGGNTANFTPIQMWRCGALGGANQRWTLNAWGEIRFGGPDGKCLSVGTDYSVFLHDCTAPTAQRFDVAASGEIRMRYQPGICLDVAGWTDAQYLAGNGLPFDGQRVQAFNCLAVQQNQKWELSGRLRHDATGRCLRRALGGDQNGTGLEVADCGAGAQEFDYYLRPYAFGDSDGDGIPDAQDNCPFYASLPSPDTDGDGRGDECECGDQNRDGRNTVSDLVAINAAIFNPGLVTPLCDANHDLACNVRDIVAVNLDLFTPTSDTTCARQPLPGP